MQETKEQDGFFVLLQAMAKAQDGGFIGQAI